MISIITCSIKPDLLISFSDSLKNTIGVEYELINFDNREKKWGLCKVYNFCSRQAKFNYLLYVHEDVIFHTKDWGIKLIKHLNNAKVGLVGIAGSTYKSLLPGPWWGVPENMKRIHIIQGQTKNPLENIRSDDKEEVVAVIDGVFMACRKEVWLMHQFDELIFNGFHNYDLDISLAINQTHQVVCVSDILIEHFSNGSYSNEWLESIVKITKKWKKVLPFSINKYSKSEIAKLEIKSYEQFIILLSGRTKNILHFSGHLLLYIIKTRNIKFSLVQFFQWIKRLKYQ